jgi:two-component system phosphate regulon response regulator OmpR
MVLGWPPARRTSGSDRVETPVPAAGRHLLVVDDDELVRETTAQMARELGYTIEIATGAADARRLLAAPDNRFDAAVLDCAMPDGNGVDIVRERRLAGDRRPMVLISGMAEASRIGTGILDRRTRFLAKPFSRSMLDRTLRILLRSEDRGDQESSSTFAAMQRESSIQMAIRPDDRQPPG